MANSAKKIVIVGGVAGGMSAAARARRLSENSEIVVLEKSGYVSYANCGLPYYLGREIAKETDLILQTPHSLLARFNIDVRLLSEVIDIDTKLKAVTVKDHATDRIYQERFDDLVLSMGAAPIRPRLPGIDLPGQFTLRGVEDIQAIEKWIEIKKVTRIAI
ncbi:MAG: FAD-dependent oxidoreductase, partial [Cyanobacteria bacterium REEB67]|nr:FAD-dependent oxidoreductase [Cyanobacteria bacterium REEB67]